MNNTKNIFIHSVKTVVTRKPVRFPLYDILENGNYNFYLEMATWVGLGDRIQSG